MGTGSPVSAARRETVRFGALVLGVARAGRFTLGFLATLIIAHLFGARPEVDAFFVARILPLIFMDWAGNILKVGFIPTFAEVRARRGEEAASAVASQTAGWLALGFAAFTVICAAAAGPIVRILATGFDAHTHALAVDMLRWLSPSILASGLFLILETLLNANHHFSSPARGRVWGRLAVVLTLPVLSRFMGHSAMPAAFLIGSLAQLLGAGPAGYRTLRELRPRLGALLPGTREVMALLGPAAVWMLLDQLKFVVDQNFASRLAPGQLAALGYAFQIVQVSVAVTGGAYLTALFPRLADLMADGRSVAPAATRAGQRVLMLSALPAVYFMATRELLVSVVLQRGAFGASDTASTAGALFWYAPAVVFVAFNMLLKVLLFLRRRIGPILWLGAGELALNVILNALLIGPMGIAGLALATSATTLVVMLTLPAHLARDGLLMPAALRDTALRLLPGTAAAGVLAWGVCRSLSPDSIASGVLVLAVAGVLAAGVYLGVGRLMGLRGIHRLRARERGDGV